MDVAPVTIKVPVSQVKTMHYAGSFDEYMAEQREENRSRNAMSQTYAYNSDAVNIQISQSNSAPIPSPDVQAAFQSLEEYMMAQHGLIKKESGMQFESVVNRFLSLDIITDEGDKIDIRSSVGHSKKTKEGQILQLGGEGSYVDVKIKGELNESEKKDVQDLLNKFNKVVELTEKVQSGYSDTTELESAINDLEATSTNQNSLKTYSSKVEVDAASGYAPHQQLVSPNNLVPYHPQAGVNSIQLTKNKTKTTNHPSGDYVTRHLDNLSTLMKNMLDRLKPDFEGELAASLIRNNYGSAVNFYSPKGAPKKSRLSVIA